MTKEQAAEMLNGNEYSKEVSEAQQKLLIDNRLCAVFGYSDDNMEIVGFWCEEISAYEGATVKVDKEGILENKCDDSRCPYFIEKAKNTKQWIAAKWCKVDDCSWFIDSNIPFAPFDIMEDGSRFCRGIVFSVDDIG